ncbi:Sigma factor SigB regulation protein RsbQ [Zhongshania aliphaticivorans]|uniref:Sigma factor SigB regulation protein RsbQ n=1 Tax=Zhongshania aliphaticivorans TaxID=1470434 RepID=A0A5S9NAL0_9GAMM|nr:alpha/beta hydrolase [Zhongshania aliphaticivorans]CAA0078764.1 Sigma factor SigB regulation protein RsbQ [Zhongshania aliphaticivorans]CAA0086536.1 Sigma factor SigB regulation protein RsbQ [Zhongshania aliphaticivorans]
MPAMDVLRRNNVQIIGNGEHTLLMAHGFGCDQNMWRFLTPSLQKNFRIVLFDYVGSGHSEVSTYSSQRYSQLEGYSQDVIEICDALKLQEITFIGHSVSSMIGLIVANQQPNLFSKLIMVCPSPCFLNLPPEYMGGFDHQDLEELISLMDKNYIGWANYLAPLVLGSAHQTELLDELTGSFCSTDPIIAKNFAKATFFGDHRDLLSKTLLPCLLLQSSDDILAPLCVGQYMKTAIANSELHIIEAHGHCLHMTHPENIKDKITEFALRNMLSHEN